MPRLNFPDGSLLAAMLHEQAPADLRRTSRRLRADGAPVLAVDNSVADLAQGLALSEISRAPALLDVLPPLFWLETRRGNDDAPTVISGWIVEKKRNSLLARGFVLLPGDGAIPEAAGTVTVPFGSSKAEEDEETRDLRGLIAVVSLPEMMAQMGESSPIMLLPAEAPDQDAPVLRGFRLSVAISPDAAPT